MVVIAILAVTAGILIGPAQAYRGINGVINSVTRHVQNRITDRPRITFHGQVVDVAGNPIRDSIVTVTWHVESWGARSAKRMLPGNDGRFQVERVLADTLTVNFNKPGYEPADERILAFTLHPSHNPLPDTSPSRPYQFRLRETLQPPRLETGGKSLKIRKGRVNANVLMANQSVQVSATHTVVRNPEGIAVTFKGADLGMQPAFYNPAIAPTNGYSPTFQVFAPFSQHVNTQAFVKWQNPEQYGLLRISLYSRTLHARDARLHLDWHVNPSGSPVLER